MLYMMHKNGYPEDYVFVYQDSLESAVQRYCKVCDLEPMTLDQFHEAYTYYEISEIDGRTIKEIVFEA